MVNLSGNDSNVNKTSVVMRKINEALLLASDEHEILAAIGLSANDDASLHLLYVDWDTHDPLNGLITKVAGWDSGNQSSSEELNMQRSIKDQLDISNFVRALANSGDPVWIVEDLSSAIGSAAYPYFALDCRGLAAVKLQSLGHSSTDPQHTWNSVICFTWSTPHQFSPEEKYIFAEISQFASVVVSNHRLHKQILANIARLQQLDKLKDEFLYSVSHELRTPLGSIITLSEAILAGADGELVGNLRSDVESIHNSGQYLFSMISDILDFASIESGSIRLDPQPSDIGEIISNAVREIRPMVETQKKHLKIQIDVGIDAPLIWADRTRTFQVILNLLSNAIKFTDHGVIQIRAYIDSAYLVICVSDEGIGIAPEQQLVIFEKFRQVNGALTRQVGGTGLGLAICKQLIELQGGRIWVTSALGRGSSFCFSLPVLRESAYETPLH